MTRRGDITILAVLCLSVLGNIAAVVMARTSRSAVSRLEVAGTNVTVHVTQIVSPQGGEVIDLPLGKGKEVKTK